MPKFEVLFYQTTTGKQPAKEYDNQYSTRQRLRTKRTLLQTFVRRYF